MKKWGTKSDLGGAIIFTTIAVDAIFDLNPYLLIVSAITDWYLYSSVYSGYKAKKRKG